MEEEVEITVIATGFSGATLSDDMKEEVKRTVVTDTEKAESFIHNDLNANSRMFNLNKNVEEPEEEEEEEVQQKTMSSRVEVDDSSIPPFLRKMKNKRF